VIKVGGKNLRWCDLDAGEGGEREADPSFYPRERGKGRESNLPRRKEERKESAASLPLLSLGEKEKGREKGKSAQEQGKILEQGEGKKKN